MPEKKTGNGKRCPRGTRKGADGVCHPFKKIQKAKTAKTTSKPVYTIEEQLEYLRKQEPNLLVIHKPGVIYLKHKTNESECAEFNLAYRSTTELHISNLSRCGEISGTKLLNIIKSFAKKFGYKKLQLVDASELLGTPIIRKVKSGSCRISLALLSVLATGETWYNRLGFNSVYTKKEKIHNHEIIQQPFITFITRIAERVEYTKKRSNYLPTLEDLIHGMYYYVDDSDSDITVQNLFKKAMADLRDKNLVCENKDKPEMDWLVDIEQFLTKYGAFQENIKNKLDDNIVMVLEDKDGYVLHVKRI
jgi:hypothetical protein